MTPSALSRSPLIMFICLGLGSALLQSSNGSSQSDDDRSSRSGPLTTIIRSSECHGPPASRVPGARYHRSKTLRASKKLTNLWFGEAWLPPHSSDCIGPQHREGYRVLTCTVEGPQS